MSPERIRLAIRAANAHTFMDSGHPGRKGLTIDMLACELQRVETLLTGMPYYDYDLQKWIN